MNKTTRILQKIEAGDSAAAKELLPLVYDDLRKLASARIAQEREGHSLDATALVHEAYLRLVNVDSTQRFNSRGHFFAAAAEAMRRILVELARQKASMKRGGAHQRVSADLNQIQKPDKTIEILQVNDALDELSKEDPQLTKLVKMKYFAGMSLEESAEALGISERTAYRYWAYAKAWLRSAIDSDKATGEADGKKT